MPVRDLIREFAAEQKMLLAQKASVRIGTEYIDWEDDQTPRRKNTSGRSNKQSSKESKGGRSKPSNNKPSKFRKHWRMMSKSNPLLRDTFPIVNPYQEITDRKSHSILLKKRVDSNEYFC